MSVSSKCPTPAQLRELLDGAHSDPELADAVAHLDHCTGCQQSLEALANDDDSFAKTLLDQHSYHAPEPASAYWPALHSAEQTLLPGAAPGRRSLAVALDFLTPSEDGQYLGSLGHFNVVRVVGRGGMGLVLHAVDTCLERDVALKLLDPELNQDELARSRFCREARAAASINHENVVAVHQVEHEEGKDIPFLVMELITGESLETKLARDRRLSLKEIVRIGMQTAAGLAAAHEKGLIHRDIKPGNILLEQSGQRVKLTDFGLARAAEDVRLTRSGLVAGTPLYMSPEQARGDELDARSDLFSLGIVLYELAAGEPPFTGKTPLAVLKRLTDDKHQPLRERNPDLPEWFAGIVDRLLAKDPKDRFQSARDVANTLEHFWALLKSSSETLVCPKKKAAHIWKAATLGAVAGMLTLLLGAGAFFFMFPGGGGPDKILAPIHVFQGNSGPVWNLALSHDGKNLLMGLNDGTVKIWDIAEKSVTGTLDAHHGAVWALALSPGDDYLATGSDDDNAKIWDLKTRKEFRQLPTPGGARALAFDPDGKRLLMGDRKGTVKVWDVQTAKEILHTAGHKAPVVTAAFSPDGKMMATGDGDKLIKVWDAHTGKEKLKLQGHHGGVFGIAFAPTAPLLLSGGWDRTVRLWDLKSGSELAKLEGHEQDVWSVAFSPDGSRFASTGEDQTVRIWDTESRKEVQVFRGANSALYNVRFSPEPGYLAAGGRDGMVRMWYLPVLKTRN